MRRLVWDTPANDRWSQLTGESGQFGIENDGKTPIPQEWIDAAEQVCQEFPDVALFHEVESPEGLYTSYQFYYFYKVIE